MDDREAMSENFKCAECGEETTDGLGEIEFERAEGRLVIRNIPAKICPNGHQYFDGPTAAQVHRLARRLFEDMQSYSQDLTYNPAAPEEITISGIIRRAARSVA